MPKKSKVEEDKNEWIILIDTSYFTFYRYYALINWWRLAKSEEPLTIPIDTPDFVEKFKKTFIDKIMEIPKKLKIKNYKLIAATDCHRKDIWRNSLYSNYKANRTYEEDDFLGGPFFQLGLDILKELKIKTLHHPKLEADDCIAIITKKILATDNETNVLIIANDMDYLQLADPRVRLMNLKYKILTDNSKWSGNPKQDLFCKIVMGDKSDNIPSIFNKCGPVTAKKYYDNTQLFEDKLKKENAQDKLERNRKLVDFNEIPEELVKELVV
jgi:5'-3' exonuclease